MNNQPQGQQGYNPNFAQNQYQNSELYGYANPQQPLYNNGMYGYPEQSQNLRSTTSSPIENGTVAAMRAARESMRQLEDERDIKKQKDAFWNNLILNLTKPINKGESLSAFGQAIASANQAESNTKSAQEQEAKALYEDQIKQQQYQQKMEMERNEHKEKMDLERQKLYNHYNTMTPFERKQVEIKENELKSKYGDYSPDDSLELPGNIKVDMNSIKEGSLRKISTPSAKDKVANLYKISDDVYRDMEGVATLFHDYKKLKQEGNYKLNPDNPITGDFQRKALKLGSNIIGNKKLKTLDDARTLMVGAFAATRIKMESALNGGGRMLQGLTMYEENKNLFANPDKMNPEQVDASLRKMLKKSYIDLATNAIKHNRGEYIVNSDTEKLLKKNGIDVDKVVDDLMSGKASQEASKMLEGLSNEQLRALENGA